MERPKYVVRTKRQGATNWITLKRQFPNLDRAIGYAEALFDQHAYKHIKVSIPSDLGFADFWKDGIEFKDARMNMPGHFIIEDDER